MVTEGHLPRTNDGRADAKPCLAHDAPWTQPPAMPQHGSHACMPQVPKMLGNLRLVGEAYDKVARLLGLELKPHGGAVLEALARSGNPLAFR